MVNAPAHADEIQTTVLSVSDDSPRHHAFMTYHHCLKRRSGVSLLLRMDLANMDGRGICACAAQGRNTHESEGTL
jgi:hypothetical protein